MTIDKIKQKIDELVKRDKEVWDQKPLFSIGDVFHVEHRFGKEVKRWTEKNVKIPKGEYCGPGLPGCQSSCGECQGRAEWWAERIGCTPEEIWEALL